MIKQPKDGINNSEPRFAIGDNQAVELKNMRITGAVGVESIRPSTSLTGSAAFGDRGITDSVLIFRRKNETPQYLFAVAGEVYVSTSENGAATGIGFSGDPTARITMVQFRDYVYIFNGVNDNKKYDGTTLWNMGIDAPVFAPGLSNETITTANVITNPSFTDLTGWTFGGSAERDTEARLCRSLPASAQLDARGAYIRQVNIPVTAEQQYILSYYVLRYAAYHITLTFKTAGGATVSTLRIPATGSLYATAGGINSTTYTGPVSTAVDIPATTATMDLEFCVDEVNSDNDFHIDDISFAIPEVPGLLSREYYYTYYNSQDDIESDPSPVGISGVNAISTQITVTASTDPQVDAIRIYRTGEGILIPRLAKELPNTSGTYSDVSVDADVASAKAISFEHAKPVILANGMIFNNRLFAWGDAEDNDTLWVSNEYHPEYMPKVPFIESTVATSGGPIQIMPGDGGTIMSFVPWGGAGIVFKDTAVYRIQESEVGFYTYQTMPIPGCVAPYSVQLTPEGVVWLSQVGWLLMDYQEHLTDFGSYVRETINQIDDYDLVSSAVSRGYYVTSFKKTSGEWKSLSFYNGGWQGEHDELVGSSYFTDVDGTLYAGRISSTAGIEKLELHTLGYPVGQQAHSSVPISWIDGAREYTVGAYSRIRKVRIEGRVLSTDTYKPELNLNVYNEYGQLLDSNIFELPRNGAVEVWLSEAVGQYLSIAIEGTTTRPIAIVAMTPMIEGVGRI